MDRIEAAYQDLTDDEDFLQLVNIVLHPRAPRNFRVRPNHLEIWNNKEFISRFRLSKEIVRLIVGEISDEIVCLKNENSAVSPTEMVLVTLRYLATGSFLQVSGDFCGIDKSTTSRILIKVLRSIARLRSQFIKMPSTPEDIRKIQEGFFNISRFPKCVGALDCTHVKIQSPGGANAELYRNRKGFFSMNVQAVCDSNLKFQNIVCRWPGSSHDSNIFSNSRLRARIENEEFGNDSLLVGDGGYGIKSYLITPLRNPDNPAEQLFNESQIRTRNPIERCFGVWKRRFPVLALGIRININKVEALVVAAAVLHNIAIENGEPEPEANEEVAAAIRLANGINLDLPPERNLGLNINDIVRHNLITQYFQIIKIKYKCFCEI